MRTLVTHPDFVADDLIADATPVARNPPDAARNHAAEPDSCPIYEPPPQAPRRARRITTAARRTQENLLLR